MIGYAHYNKEPCTIWYRAPLLIQRLRLYNPGCGTATSCKAHCVNEPARRVLTCNGMSCEQTLERLIESIVGYNELAGEVQSHHTEETLGVYNIVTMIIVRNIDVKIAAGCRIDKILNLISGEADNLLILHRGVPPFLYAP